MNAVDCGEPPTHGGGKPGLPLVIVVLTRRRFTGEILIDRLPGHVTTVASALIRARIVRWIMMVHDQNCRRASGPPPAPPAAVRKLGRKSGDRRLMMSGTFWLEADRERVTGHGSRRSARDGPPRSTQRENDEPRRAVRMALETGEPLLRAVTARARQGREVAGAPDLPAYGERSGMLRSPGPQAGADRSRSTPRCAMDTRSIGS